MDTDNSLNWRKTPSGQYERELDAPEMFYTSMAKTWKGTGHTYFAITASVDFTIDIPSGKEVGQVVTQTVAAFQSAWKKLRYHFPTIAAEVVYDTSTKKCKKIYNTPGNEQGVDSWMQETFFVVEDVISGKDFVNLDQQLGRFGTLYLLTHPASSGDEELKDEAKGMNLLFRCGHDIIDGIGSLKLLEHLFKCAADAYESPSLESTTDFGDEQKNLSPCFQIVAGVLDSPTEQQILDLKTQQAANNQVRENAEVIGYLGEIETKTPGRSQRIGIKIKTQDTARIINTCKAFGVTATHLFHAAIALALGEIQKKAEEERCVKYATYALIDLRGICGKLSGLNTQPDSVLHTVSVKHLFVDLTIPAKSDGNTKLPEDRLLGSLLQVKNFYQSNVIDTDFLATVPTVWNAGTPPYPEAIPEVPEPGTFRTVSLSSLGLIDKLIHFKHGAFNITDPWVIGAEYSTGLGAFLGTFRGEMSLSAGYNEAFHSVSSVLAYLEAVKDAALDILAAMEKSL